MNKSGPHFNFCPGKGYLVGGTEWIPDASFDYQADLFHPIVGCNQIYCAGCKKFVRQRTGYKMVDSNWPKRRPRARKLCKTDDWDSLDFLKRAKNNSVRIYYCACLYYSTSSRETLDGYSSMYSLYTPKYGPKWKCHGHPPFQIPTEIYGFPLTVPEDVEPILNAIVNLKVKINDALPKNEPDLEAFLLARLYKYLSPGPIKDRIDQIICEFLVHPKAIFRSLALQHLKRFPKSPAAKNLAQVFTNKPKLFKGIDHPHKARGKGDFLLAIRLVGLEKQMLEAILSYLPYADDKSSLKLIRGEILKGETEFNWQSHTTAIGTDWIKENDKAIILANPKANLEAILEYLAKTDVTTILKAIRNWNP